MASLLLIINRPKRTGRRDELLEMKFYNMPTAKFLSFFFPPVIFREIEFNHFLEYANDKVREKKPLCDSRS